MMIDSEIKKYANEIKEAFCNTIPIDVYHICDGLGIKIYFENISSEGYLICENGKTSIIINKTIHDSRKVFSIAHELGHFYLPSHSKFIFHCTYDDMSHKANKPIEIEANKFASQLLMPDEQIKEDINGDISVSFISDEANKFNVSFSTMAIRLTQLAYDTMALICVNDRKIIWSLKSEDFKFELYTGKISIYSIASDLFDDAKYQIKSSNVSAGIWLQNPLIDNVYEESVYFPSYNGGYTIIHYKPDDINIDEERRN